MIDEVFRGLKSAQDDILVFGDSVESHSIALKKTLDRLSDFNLTLHKEKNYVALSAGDDLAKSAGDDLAKSAGDDLAKSAGDDLAKSAGDDLAKSAGDELAKFDSDEVPMSTSDAVAMAKVPVRR
ncbi:hypothetical protein NDU88_001522 [Pleurodeles waltl]|uniref:Uncharacterized protein n=1 Tax=Pleurodeles waltl TaxID=8319 RepID=A0AAV7T0E0_PLEWA|nr:hypothetical protein NDU88_001522 [Pleurodeles waltl]